MVADASQSWKAASLSLKAESLLLIIEAGNAHSTLKLHGGGVEKADSGAAEGCELETWLHREEAASPTLNEAFADFEDALPTDRESVAYEGAEPIMSSSSTSFEGKDSEDSSESEAGDDAFEQGN